MMKSRLQLNKSLVLFYCLMVVIIGCIVISPQPSHAQITDPDVDVEGGNLIIRYSYEGTPGLFHIYIDSDRNRDTGFRIDLYDSLFAANYLVEDSVLLANQSPGYTYQWQDWVYRGPVIQSRPNGTSNTYEWKIPLTSLNLCREDETSAGIRLVYETATIEGQRISISQIVDYQVDCSLTESTRQPRINIGIPSTRIAIPGYVYPEAIDCSGLCYWTQAGDAAPVVGIFIANPNSGPGEVVDDAYVAAIQRLQEKGVKVLGYVRTRYSEREVEEVYDDVDLYYNWYDVDGIFLDEVSETCNALPYYEDTYSYIKSKESTSTIAINPGTNTQECYLDVAEVIVTFEGTFDRYRVWEPSDWEDGYPATRFWNIVHSTSQEDLVSAINLAMERNIGWIYVTPDVMGTDNNPYDILPIGDYWADLVEAVQDAE